MFNRVAEFHRVFGHPVGTAPHLPTDEVRALRTSLIHEELQEYCKAYAENDRVEMADALADLLYVLAGTAVAYGVAPVSDVPMDSPYEGLPPVPDCPSDYDELLREDFARYQQAEAANDLDAISSAIFHMMVEIFGVARQSRIPINAVFAEVHRSNMSKLENGVAVRREDGKILKGKNYSPPDIAAVLDMCDDD